MITLKRTIYFIIALVLIVSVILVYEKTRSLLGFKWLNPQYNSEQIKQSYSQFISLNSLDEYVIAELVSQENFILTDYKKWIGNLVIGETEARLDLVAHFKYYCQLSQLSVKWQNNEVVLSVPQLILSKPVAFESSSLNEESKRHWFGKNPLELQSELRQKLSSELVSKGNAALPSMMPTAAESLAKNFFQFLQNNPESIPFDRIRVRIGSNGSKEYLFEFQQSACGANPCHFRFDFGENRQLVLP